MPSISSNLGGDMKRPSMAWKQGPYGGRVSPENATEIRRLISEGVLQREIAKRFGISQPLVSKFKRGFRKT